MAARPQTLSAALRAPLRPRHLSKVRLLQADGARTTVFVASYHAGAVEPSVERLPEPMPLERWCRLTGAPEAIVGGFYARPHGTPLGELRTHGMLREHVPFTAPYDGIRACVHVDGGRLRIARRDRLPAEPRGDLLQAGPLLLCDGEPVVAGDPEGFSAGRGQFDSDITDGRYPRAALAVAGDRIVAVVCEGRAWREAGLTLEELAGFLRGLGATEAVNLDGGGSASLICGGRLRNRPRESHGVVIDGGRAVSTAIVFNRV